MENPTTHVLECCQFCCIKCKALFPSNDVLAKHQQSCSGNPFKSSAMYFACERKIYLQLFPPEDFQSDSYYNLLNFSKDDSFLDHVVKIRLPQDVFDPSIFLRTETNAQPQIADPEFLLDANIDALDSDVNYLDTGKASISESIEQGQLQNIINKNIDYLKNEEIINIESADPKHIDFNQGTIVPRLLSPFEKSLNFLNDGSKSRVLSPFEKCVNYLQDTGPSFHYTSNQFIPLPCSLSTDLLGSYPSLLDENQQSLNNNIEESRTLQCLDLAKKDPFFGQNLGLVQLNSINTKDPFLINSENQPEKAPAVSVSVAQQPHNQIPQLTKGCDDLQPSVSPTFPLQDGNYFNYPSTLDEPTQLDYLDLATIDFLTNPNLGTYGIQRDKTTYGDQEQDRYSEDNFLQFEQTNPPLEKKIQVPKIRHRQKIKKTASESGKLEKRHLKGLNLKKVKSPILKKDKTVTNLEKKRLAHETIEPILETIGRDLQGTSAIERDLNSELFSRQQIENNKPHPRREKTISGQRKRKISANESESCFIDTYVDFSKPKRKRRVSDSQRMCQTNKILNISETLSGYNLDEKKSFTAVIGQSGCIFVKKQLVQEIGSNIEHKISVINPPACQTTLNDVSTYNSRDKMTDIETLNATKFLDMEISANNEDFSDKCISKALTSSVLRFKCTNCGISCGSVAELALHHSKCKQVDVVQDYFDKENNAKEESNDMAKEVSLEEPENSNPHTVDIGITLSNSEEALSSQHLPASSYTCQICDFSCDDVDIFTEHFTVHVNDEVTEKTEPKNVETDKEEYHITGMANENNDENKEVSVHQNKINGDETHEVNMEIIQSNISMTLSNYKKNLEEQSSLLEIFEVTVEEIEKASDEKRNTIIYPKVDKNKELNADKTESKNLKSIGLELGERNNGIDIKNLQDMVKIEQDTICQTTESYLPKNYSTKLTESEIHVPLNCIPSIKSEQHVIYSDYHSVYQAEFKQFLNSEDNVFKDDTDKLHNDEKNSSVTDLNENQSGTKVAIPNGSQLQNKVRTKQTDTINKHQVPVMNYQVKVIPNMKTLQKDFSPKEGDSQGIIPKGKESLKQMTLKQTISLMKQTIIKPVLNRSLNMTPAQTNSAEVETVAHNTTTHEGKCKEHTEMKQKDTTENAVKIKSKSSSKYDSITDADFSCEQCDFKAKNKQALTYHMSKHRNTAVTHSCTVPECQFQTMYKQNLAHHVQTQHTDDKPFLCDQCTYSTADSICLLRHIQHNHLKEKRFKCTDCDYVSLFRIDIVKHYRNHHQQQKLYACNQCEYKTGYTNLLKLHLMSHAGIKPFKCSACPYQVNNRNKVNRHISTFHKADPGITCVKLDLTFEVDCKQFQCEEMISNKEINVIELTDEEVNKLSKRDEGKNMKKSQRKQTKKATKLQCSKNESQVKKLDEANRINLKEPIKKKNEQNGNNENKMVSLLGGLTKLSTKKKNPLILYSIEMDSK